MLTKKITAVETDSRLLDENILPTTGSSPNTGTLSSTFFTLSVIKPPIAIVAPSATVSCVANLCTLKIGSKIAFLLSCDV
jgi:hypothetical protein